MSSPTPIVPAQADPDPNWLAAQARTFFSEHGRPLPWRQPSTTPWGVLVSEVMSQQTPVARVEPRWVEWMDRWPTPAHLAAAPLDEVLRAWDTLGYPRRALRLHECARAIVARYGGAVPEGETALRALPGVGAYTAAAVMAFAFRRRAVVLDTNIRRVLSRVVAGQALPAPHLARAEQRWAEAMVPRDDGDAADWAAGLMELGALVCTARAPECDVCPFQSRCRWFQAGKPADVHAHKRRTQPWAGTDRQVRGRIMAHLRGSNDVVHSRVTLLVAARGAGGKPADPTQDERALDSLVADGLVSESHRGYSLPATR